MTSPSLTWQLERACYFHGHLFVDGWAFSRDGSIDGVWVVLADGRRLPVGYGYPRPETARLQESPIETCGFSADIPIGHPDDARCEAIVFSIGGSELIHRVSDLVEEDPYHQLFRSFVSAVTKLPHPLIVEIGARARSGNVNTGWIPPGAKYVGVDISPGPNVDLVCDAHELSSRLELDSVDAVFSISTMEHLAMPWKAVLEIGRVLRLGGLAFFATHQTWPLHDEPHDYWRFSSHTWPVLLNEATGFAIEGVAMGLAGSVLPDIAHGATVAIDYQPAYLGSAALARKIGGSTLHWDVSPADFT